MAPNSQKNQSPVPTFSPPLKLAALALFLIFAGLRFYQLEVRPFHNDEGVNAWFVGNLIRDNNFKYDPNNYHGPSLFYVHAAATWIWQIVDLGPSEFSLRSIKGVNDWSLRTPTVLAGLLILLGALLCYRRVGVWGALTSFALLGLSLDMIYYGRYFIHEIYLVLATLGMYLGVVWYHDSKKSKYLGWALISLVVALTTKETWIISAFVLMFSYVCSETALYLLSDRQSKQPLALASLNIKQAIRAVLTEQRVAIVFAVLLWMLLFTSFFNNWQGLLDFFKTYAKWTKEGMESGHNKPFGYFLTKILIPYEYPLVLMSIAGWAAAVWKKDRNGLYLSFWTIGMLLAYSLIPYKTPWCVLNIILPMALLSGYGVQTIIDHQKTDSEKMKWGYPAIAVTILVLILLPVRKTLRVAYVEHDVEIHPQPYVHTSRDIYQLVSEINRVAATSGLGENMTVNIVSEGYWPLPFYLRHYPQALYWGKYQGIPEYDAPVVIASPAQRAGLAPFLKDTYIIQEFALRNNYPVEMYVNVKYARPQPKAVPAGAKITPHPTPVSLQPGILRSVYRGRRFIEPALRTTLELSEIEFRWNKEKDKTEPSPFSMIYRAYLKITEAGAYTFSLESDDGSWFYMGHQLVIDNGGTHASKSETKTVKLEAGYYPIEVRYFDVGGGAQLRLQWMNQSGFSELVPQSAFFVSAEEAARMTTHAR